MTLLITRTLLQEMQQHVKGTYPYEGGGFLIGRTDEQGHKIATEIRPFANQRAIADQHNRILITDEMYQAGEEYADGKDLLLIGFFHSHPDHPARPSEFDREHALPWWSYVIVSVQQGHAADVLSWELRADRSAFDEEQIVIGEAASHAQYLSVDA